MVYRVQLSYPWTAENKGLQLDAKLETLAKSCGGEGTDSGCGFGARDIGFQFTSRAAAEKFITAVGRSYKQVDVGSAEKSRD